MKNQDYVQKMIWAAELERRTGVRYHYIRKWASEGLIPFSKRPGERAMYPEFEAEKAVKRILEESGLKHRKQGKFRIVESDDA